MANEQANAGATASAATPGRPWWWKLLGVRRRQGRFLRFVPTKWGWCLLGVLLFLGSGVGFAEYSMQPDFCRSCHLMEPYYQAWHQSTHKDVPCGDCHFEPGWRNTLKGKWEASSQAIKFITGTYGSKPHAEVRDASCLRSGCHERRLLEGKVNWPVKTQRGDELVIRFDHTPHMTQTRRGQHLRCVSCHSQIVQGQHIVVTLDSCFLCHFKGFKHGRDDQTLGGCKSCHEAPKQEIRLATGMFNHAQYIDRGVECISCHSDSISGDGAVPRQVCWNCHNQPAQVARYSDSAFLHRQHVSDRKVECSSCHVQITHSLYARAPGGSDLLGQTGMHQLADAGACGQCHERSHGGALELYRGTGGRGVADMPSVMFGTQVDCIACHRQMHRSPEQAQFQGQNFRATQEACDRCHGRQYAGHLAEWKTSLDLLLARAEAALALARPRVREAAIDLAGLEQRRWLDDAEHNVRLVRQGRGVHNVTYATALLNVAIANCQKITGLAGSVPAAATAPAP